MKCQEITLLAEQHVEIVTEPVAWEYDETVTFRCKYGYGHLNGSMSLTCTENGTWSDDPPFCASKH